MINRGTILGLCLFSIFQSVAQINSRHNFNITYNKGEIVVDHLVAQKLDSLYEALPDQCILQLSFHQSHEGYLTPGEKQAIQKKRALNAERYFENKFVEIENAYIQYSSTPSLIVYKPKATLTASGNIDFSLLDQECALINSITPDVIYTQWGTKIEFQPNSFEAYGNQMFDASKVNICIYEFKSKTDLVLGQLSTHSNKDMLETAGSFYIEASDINGVPLHLKANRSFEITIYDVTNESPIDFYTFKGNVYNQVVNWSQVPNSRNQSQNESYETQGVVIDSETGEEYFVEGEFEEEMEYVSDALVLKSTDLGWINCDRFYDVENKTNLIVKLNSDSSMCVRMVFNDIKSVLPGFQISNNKANYEFTNVPIGERVLLLAYSVKNNDAQLGYKEVVIGEDFNNLIAVNEMSTSQFEGMIRELVTE